MDKNKLLEKINKYDLTDSQLNEIENILSGDISDRTLIGKAEDILKKFISILSPSVWVLSYRLLTLLIIVSLIYLLAIREPENSTQVWTIVGAFIGFIFGQKSSFLRF